MDPSVRQRFRLRPHPGCACRCPWGAGEGAVASGSTAGESRRDQGFALLDALLSVALLGLLAIGTLSLLHGGTRTAREAAQVDRAVGAAQSCVARLAARSFHELPEHFGADHGGRSARLDTENGTAPDAWSRLVEGLGDGAVAAELTALGSGGAASTFEQAVALRVTVTVSWRAVGGHAREVQLVDTRF